MVQPVAPIKKIPQFLPTPQQRKWMEKKKKDTGNSFATILKDLIQEKIDNE